MFVEWWNVVLFVKNIKISDNTKAHIFLSSSLTPFGRTLVLTLCLDYPARDMVFLEDGALCGLQKNI